jgi:hypothetical protein
LSAHELVLALHSLTRWLVLGAALFAEAVALHGCFTGRALGALDRSVTRTLVALTDLQVSLGLTLYFVVSPVARLARADWSATWPQPTLRFFGVLHPSLAAVAAIAAHAAWIGARRAPTAARHHRRVALGVAAMLVLLALAIPWPGNEPQRPLIRLL